MHPMFLVVSILQGTDLSSLWFSMCPGTGIEKELVFLFHFCPRKESTQGKHEALSFKNRCDFFTVPCRRNVSVYLPYEEEGREIRRKLSRQRRETDLLHRKSVRNASYQLLFD